MNSYYPPVSKILPPKKFYQISYSSIISSKNFPSIMIFQISLKNKKRKRVVKGKRKVIRVQIPPSWPLYLFPFAGLRFLLRFLSLSCSEPLPVLCRIRIAISAYESLSLWSFSTSRLSITHLEVSVFCILLVLQCEIVIKLITSLVHDWGVEFIVNVFSSSGGRLVVQLL